MRIRIHSPGRVPSVPCCFLPFAWEGIRSYDLLFVCRDEGGLEYKASIADTIIAVIEENPEAKENGLSHLCEFIEDCEHTSLAVKILHLLGTNNCNFNFNGDVVAHW